MPTRAGDVQSPHDLAEPVAILGQVDRLGEVPRIFTPAAASSAAKFNGVWPPN